MSKQSLYTCYLVIVVFVHSVLAGNVRDRYVGYPQNMLCVYTNAARFDPFEFVRQHRGDNGRVSCSVPRNLGPVYWDSGLEQAANAHSSDMAQNKFMGHQTSNGNCGEYGSCDTFDRVYTYFDGNAAAENVAAGNEYRDIGSLMTAWITSPGHCQNIANSKYNRVGCGVAQGSDAYGFRATQNFGSVNGNGQNYPIVCAGHLPSTSQSLLSVNAAIYTSTSPISVVALVDGVAHSMKLVLGKSTAGQYEVTVNGLSANRCHSYSIEARDGSGKLIDRYPSKGSLLSNNYGICRQVSDSSINTVSSGNFAVPSSPRLTPPPASSQEKSEPKTEPKTASKQEPSAEVIKRQANEQELAKKLREVIANLTATASTVAVDGDCTAKQSPTTLPLLDNGQQNLNGTNSHGNTIDGDQNYGVTSKAEEARKKRNTYLLATLIPVCSLLAIAIAVMAVKSFSRNQKLKAAAKSAYSTDVKEVSNPLPQSPMAEYDAYSPHSPFPLLDHSRRSSHSQRWQ